MFDASTEGGQLVLTVRFYRPEDAIPLGRVYFRAVRDGASRLYSPEQCAAWAPHAPASAVWRRRLAHGETLVAEQDGAPVGFMSLIPATGLIDLAYVLPEVMGKGVAPALYALLEGRARASGLDRLGTDASEGARPFFLRHGWKVIARQDLVRDGVALHNYRMEKRLSPDATA